MEGGYKSAQDKVLTVLHSHTFHISPCEYSIKQKLQQQASIDYERQNSPSLVLLIYKRQHFSVVPWKLRQKEELDLKQKQKLS